LEVFVEFKIITDDADERENGRSITKKSMDDVSRVRANIIGSNTPNSHSL
jgi:hypothetical protein